VNPTKSSIGLRAARLGLAPLVLIAAALSNGCARVEPWARGNLARDDMSIEHDAALRKLRDHAFVSKEAAQGGHGGSGGGCGCN